MERLTQGEEEKYQMGRRDGFKGIPEQSDDPFYLSGWRQGSLEKLDSPPKTDN